MKRLIGVITLILLLVTTTLSQTGCSGETEEAESTASESNRWLELLRVLPENEVTLKAAFLQDSAYLEEKRQRYTQISDEYTIIRSQPLFGISPDAYSDEEWKATLGFVAADVDRRVYAGERPLSYYEAVQGRFNRDDIDNAVKAGPMNEWLIVVSYRGQEYYSWSGDNEINLDLRSNVRRLGRGHRLVLADDFIFWVRWTDGIKEMIDSYQNNIDSLADNEDYILLAGALEDLDVVTAFFSAETQSYGHIIDTYRQVFEEPWDDEMWQLFVEEIKMEPRLKPYQALATGAGLDEKGYYLAIAIVNSSEEVAKENAVLLEQRLGMMKITTAWPDQSGRPWYELVDSAEIESKNRLTMAKIYGKAAEAWVNFDVTNLPVPYEPLLLYD